VNVLRRRPLFFACCAAILVLGCREPSRSDAPRPVEAAPSVVGTGSTSTTTAAPATKSEPPPPLACLTRYYTGRAVHDDGGWWLELPDHTRIPYQSGTKKSFPEQLSSPDVKDVFSLPYRPGAIVAVHVVDEDPGRIRLDPLFRATYGASAAAVKSSLVVVTIRGQALSVHRRVEGVFRKVAERLDSAVAKDPTLDPFLHALGGTFIWRNIAGTDRQSAHSYGVSLDLNPALSHYWRSQGDKALTWTNKIPQPIVDAFEAEGFIWGGRWFHYDTMHFEYRPELLDPSCRPG
jgi:hypothetical protein